MIVTLNRPAILDCFLLDTTRLGLKLNENKLILESHVIKYVF